MRFDCGDQDRGVVGQQLERTTSINYSTMYRRGSKLVVAYEMAGDGGLVNSLTLGFQPFVANDDIRGRAQ